MSTFWALYYIRDSSGALYYIVPAKKQMHTGCWGHIYTLKWAQQKALSHNHNFTVP